MNTKSRISVVLALSALLMSSFAAWSYPAEGFKNTQALRPAAAIPCHEVLNTAADVAASIDTPSRRAEYAALDRIANCLQVAGISIEIPVTGRAAWTTSPFLAMKDRQSELLDRSGSPDHSHLDPDWMRFKERQAERMSH